MRRLNLFLLSPLLLIIALPLAAVAAVGADGSDAKVIRVRSEDGGDRIVVRRHGRSETIDMDELEDALSKLEGLDIDVGELVEEALEGLEDLDLDFDFGPNFSHHWDIDDEGYEGDFDEEAFEEWAEQLGERMERWSEQFSRHMEHAFDDDGRGFEMRGVDWNSNSDERDEMRREIRELKRQIRRLEADLDGDRKGDDGDS